jgi:hypothetical protein
MTIDEEINRFERLASDYEFNLEMHQHNVMKLSVNDIERMKRNAQENRQLAEWLRELKAYKDFENKGYVMCRFEVAQDDRHRTTKMVLDFSTKELFNNIVEVTANEEN